MDEVEVQVVQLEVFQRLLQCGTHVLWAVLGVPQLGGDEEFLASAHSSYEPGKRALTGMRVPEPRQLLTEFVL